VAFTSEDRVQDMIRNFNADGFSSLYPKYRGSHKEQVSMIHRYIIWRDNHAYTDDSAASSPG
jgi:hypothetical protein